MRPTMATNYKLINKQTNKMVIEGFTFLDKIGNNFVALLEPKGD